VSTLPKGDNGRAPCVLGVARSAL